MGKKINPEKKTLPHFAPPPSLQSWDVFFRNANAGAPPGAAYQSPPGQAPADEAQSVVGARPDVEKLIEDHLAVQSLIRAYQVDRTTYTTYTTTREEQCGEIIKLRLF